MKLKLTDSNNHQHEHWFKPWIGRWTLASLYSQHGVGVWQMRILSVLYQTLMQSTSLHQPIADLGLNFSRTRLQPEANEDETILVKHRKQHVLKVESVNFDLLTYRQLDKIYKQDIVYMDILLQSTGVSSHIWPWAKTFFVGSKPRVEVPDASLKLVIKSFLQPLHNCNDKNYHVMFVIRFKSSTFQTFIINILYEQNNKKHFIHNKFIKRRLAET